MLEGMGEEGTDVYYEGNLGLWLKNQRCMRRGTRGKLRLSPERESQLQGLVDQGKAAHRIDVRQAYYDEIYFWYSLLYGSRSLITVHIFPL